MSDLTNMEKRKFERLLEMGSGYVLNFSNRTIEEFILDSTGRAIYDSRYDYGSGSKANRLRAFWNVEPNPVVGKLMGDILDYGIEENTFAKDNPLLTDCRKVAARLMQDVPVAELDALTTISDEKDFEVVANADLYAAYKSRLENASDEVKREIFRMFIKGVVVRGEDLDIEVLLPPIETAGSVKSDFVGQPPQPLSLKDTLTLSLHAKLVSIADIWRERRLHKNFKRKAWAHGERRSRNA